MSANPLFADVAGIANGILADFGEPVYIERAPVYVPSTDTTTAASPAGATVMAVYGPVERNIVDGEKVRSTDFYVIFGTVDVNGVALAFDVQDGDWIRGGPTSSSTPRFRIMEHEQIESPTTKMLYVCRVRR